jgi:prefoldin subunit 5
LEKKKETMTQIISELHQQIEKTLERLEAVQENANNTETIPNQMRTTLTSAKRVIELQHPPKVEKTARTIHEFRT